METTETTGALITTEDLVKRPLSYSSLKEFLRSPMHFMHYRAKKREQTPALIMGELVDVLILTPDEYEKRFAIIPHDAPRKPTAAQLNAKKPSPETLEAIAWWDEFNKSLEIKGANGYVSRKTIITAEMLAEATQMRDMAFKSPHSAELLGRITETQCRLKWTDKETGLPMVSILDGVGDDLIVSLKTTPDASTGEFQKNAFNYNYHIQTAIELEAMKRKRGEFPDVYYLVIEKSEPYGVNVLKADKKFIALGDQEYRKALGLFKQCMEQGRFNEGYEFLPKNMERSYDHLELPGWALRQLHE